MPFYFGIEIAIVYGNALIDLYFFRVRPPLEVLSGGFGLCPLQFGGNCGGFFYKINELIYGIILL